MQLYLTYGAQTINFHSGASRVEDGFFPSVPDDDQESTIENFTGFFIGTDSEMRTWIRDIRRLLRIASGQRGLQSAHQPVYLNFDLDDGATAWRSRVLNGRLSLHKKLDSHYRRERLKYSLVIERDSFWEGALTAVPLTNNNGTDLTSGINVYNANDESGTSPTERVNWVSIDGVNDLVGDLRGPAMIELDYENNYNNGVFINHYIDEFGDGALAKFLSEAEDDWGSSGLSDSTCSNGEYALWVVPSSLSDIRTGTISFDFSEYKGRPMRTFVRFRSSPQVGTWAQMEFGSSLGSITTPLVRLSSQLIQTLGVAWLPYYQENDAVGISFRGYRSPSGGTIEVDCFYFVPQDGYYSGARDDLFNLVGSTTKAIEQWGDRQSYADADAGGNKRFFYNIQGGKGIWLEPGKNQYLYFMTRYNDDSDITDQIVLKVWYRPRRSFL